MRNRAPLNLFTATSIPACSEAAPDRLMIVIYRLMGTAGFLCTNVSSTNGCIDPTGCMQTQSNPSLTNASIL